MGPHLVRARSADQDISIRSLHHTRTHARTRAHARTRTHTLTQTHTYIFQRQLIWSRTQDPAFFCVDKTRPVRKHSARWSKLCHGPHGK